MVMGIRDRAGGGGGVWGRGEASRGSRVSGSEGEEDAMRIAGAVCGVGVRAQGEGVEDALDVVFLDGGEEGFVGGGEVGEGFAVRS